MQELSSIFSLFCIASLSLGTVLKIEAQKIFNVIDYGAVGDGITDDSLAFGKVWKDVCGESESIPILNIPMGMTFLLKPVNFKGPCNSITVNVQVLGNIVAPESISAWGDYCTDDCWLKFENVDGLIINGTGQIDGKGSAWWGDQVDHFNILVR
ncbi:probable polygalacturonase At3g15720 [Cornus florida]|uniref:probable polygalacturonase At3g15720 n=1 Tax=Cornus florida TaxID=4283 RepID=UPI00289F5292|nr:probable polygalacturonase At3g15720 [Cornus florida]